MLSRVKYPGQEESSLATYSFCGYYWNPEPPSPLGNHKLPTPCRIHAHGELLDIGTIRAGASLLPWAPRTLSHCFQCRYTFFKISHLLSKWPSEATETSMAMKAHLEPLLFSPGGTAPCPPDQSMLSCPADLGILCLPVSRR